MKNLKNAITKPGRESQPWVIWIWNLSINLKEMVEQLNSLIAQGFGGIAIKPGRDMKPVLNSEEFCELLGEALRIASEKKVAIRLAEDFSLPWSGALDQAMNRSRKLRAQQLVLTEIRTPSGQDEIEITDTQDCFALAVRINNGALSLADTKQLTSKSTNGPIVFKAPSADWRVFVFRKEYLRDPLNSYIPNVYNPKIAQIYIQEVFESLRPVFSKYVSSTFEGFINEMPTLLPAENAIPWDDDLVVKFRSKYKKDLIKLLPALFSENCAQAHKIRQQIYTFLQQSMYERFTSPLEAWAKKNRLSQWILCPEKSIYRNSNCLIDPVVPSETGTYSFVGLQNLDGTEQNYPLLRVVADTNSNQYRRETLSVIGRNRLGSAGTVQSLKHEIDLGLLAGSSRTIIDGCFFNVDQRSYIKTPFNPGWYSPGWEQMKPLCGYISRVQELLRDLHWNRQVAVLSPSQQVLAGYMPSNNDSAIKGTLQLQKTLAGLERCGLSFDVINEDFLSSCSVRTNGEFGTSDRIRKGNYQLLIVPYSPFISRDVLIFIEKLLQKDGKVIFVDEAPKGTSEDGATVSVTSRIEKIIDPKKNKGKVVASGALEEALSCIQPVVSITVNGKTCTDIFSACGAAEGYELYVIHNSSDSKDCLAKIELPDNKHFAAVDCESGDIIEIDGVERKNSRGSFNLSIAPRSTHFIIGSASRISQQGSKRFRHGINPFTMPQRSYRIVFKDQWTFQPLSLNALPLSTWNVRIGLSRESGGFSHFYESNFQAKAQLENCYFLLSGIGGLNGHSVIDSQIEVSVNGVRAEKLSFLPEIAGPEMENGEEPVKRGPEFPSALRKIFGSNAMIYNLSNSLVKGFNRISIRTTGFVTDPKTILYPPLIFGDFTVSKGQNGWTIDKSSALVGHDSWTKYGYPYLSGTGVYRQSFEIPNDYKKLVLRFSQVSGTTSVCLNDKQLSLFNWHPMEIDITSVCEPKRNELVITVLNTLDNLLRMNGRPSGLTGEVYLDVY